MQVLSHLFVVAGVSYLAGESTARLPASSLYGTPSAPSMCLWKQTKRINIEYSTADMIQPLVVPYSLRIASGYAKQLYTRSSDFMYDSIRVCTRGEGG